MQTTAQTLVAMAAIAVIVFVGIYAYEHITCWHIPYITSSCVVK